MTRARIAVLASGGGSNLQALIDHLHALGPQRGGDIVLVATNRPHAGALQRAERARIPTGLIRSSRLPDAEALDELLSRAAVDLVVLAGYLQLIPPDVTRPYHGRMVNVHPAPLPAFGGPGMYGIRVHRALLDAGAVVSGPTVHFVDEEYDHGATIAHWPVPILPGDDDHTLAERVLRAEHLLYPRVVDGIASGRIDAARHSPPVTLPRFEPNADTTSLAAVADRALSQLTQ